MSTIAAISTATGNGGIGIIRMSGKKSKYHDPSLYKSFPSFQKNI